MCPDRKSPEETQRENEQQEHPEHGSRFVGSKHKWLGMPPVCSEQNRNRDEYGHIGHQNQTPVGRPQERPESVSGSLGTPIACRCWILLRGHCLSVPCTICHLRRQHPLAGMLV